MRQALIGPRCGKDRAKGPFLNQDRGWQISGQCDGQLQWLGSGPIRKDLHALYDIGIINRVTCQFPRLISTRLSGM